MATTSTISALTAANAIDATADYLPIDQASPNATKRINRNTLLGITGNPLGTTDSQTVSSKTLDNTNAITVKDGSLTLQNTASATKQAIFSLASITAGQTRTLTIPDASLTIVGTTTTQTLTNKTLTSPTINSPTITNATFSADTITGFSNANNITIAGMTITSSAFVSPKITTGLNDTNNKSMLAFSATASAVNYITVTNAATGNAAALSAAGSDSNVALKITGQSTGGVYIKPKEGLVTATANNQSFTVEADITGATVTFTPDIASVCIVYGFANILANGNIARVYLTVDGVDQAAIMQFQNASAVNDVAPGFMIWRFTLTAASHTIKLRAAASSGTINVNPFGNTSDTGFYYTLISQ